MASDAPYINKELDQWLRWAATATNKSWLAANEEALQIAAEVALPYYKKTLHQMESEALEATWDLKWWYPQTSAQTLLEYRTA